jgi:DNA-binding HxlR family transcriptional regulator
LLIVRDLSTGPRRFVELQRVLPGISTEQLRSRLNRMVADGMLTRKRYREVPPRVDYELTDRARELMPILGELARWGYEWAWSPPRTSESIDIGAIFRLAPGLLRDADLRGTVQCTVEGDQPRTYTLRLSPSQATIEEHTAEGADASVTGGARGWIEAFSPQHGREALEISGDRALANRMLDALAGASPAESTAASANPGAAAAA